MFKFLIHRKLFGFLAVALIAATLVATDSSTVQASADVCNRTTWGAGARQVCLGVVGQGIHVDLMHPYITNVPYGEAYGHFEFTWNGYHWFDTDDSYFSQGPYYGDFDTPNNTEICARYWEYHNGRYESSGSGCVSVYA